jgi:hypothetical protein
MDSDELALRQQRLLLRSAALRANLSQQIFLLKKPLDAVDQVRSAWHWLVRHPEWPLGGMLLLFVIRPARTVAWGGRLWWAWRTYQRVGGWIASPKP